MTKLVTTKSLWLVDDEDRRRLEEAPANVDPQKRIVGPEHLFPSDFSIRWDWSKGEWPRFMRGENAGYWNPIPFGSEGHLPEIGEDQCKNRCGMTKNPGFETCCAKCPKFEVDLAQDQCWGWHHTGDCEERFYDSNLDVNEKGEKMGSHYDPFKYSKLKPFGNHGC